MSGGVLPSRAAGTFVEKFSFWIGSTVKLTFACAAWYEVAADCQRLLTGSVTPLCHQVRLTGPLAFDVFGEPEPPLLLLLLQAAAVRASTAVRASAPEVRILRMSGPFLTTSAELDRAC